MPTAVPGNFPDSWFINRVREILTDQPIWKGEAVGAGDGKTGVTGIAGSRPFRTTASPILAPGVLVQAPSPGATNYGQGMTNPSPYIPTYTSAAFSPTTAPVISDGGIGGSQGGIGNTIGAVTFVDSSGIESPPVISNTLSLVAAHQVTFAAISGIPVVASPDGLTVARVNYYIVSAGASGSIGLLGSQTPVAGSVPQITFSGAVSLAQAPVIVNTDTGEIAFLAPPQAGGNVQVTYQAARIRNTQIRRALFEGMHQLHPEIYQTAIDTSLTYYPTIAEYTLPPVIQNPRQNVMRVDMVPPGSVRYSIPFSSWEVRDSGTLIISDKLGWSGGSTIQIWYNAPYSALSDLELDVVELPIYYACYRLLIDQEAARSRASDMLATTQEASASAPGHAAQIAGLYLKKFQDGKKNLQRVMPHRRQVPDRIVEASVAGAGFSWN